MPCLHTRVITTFCLVIGRADVGFRSHQIKTPNIDRMVNISRFYARALFSVATMKYTIDGSYGAMCTFRFIFIRVLIRLHTHTYIHISTNNPFETKIWNKAPNMIVLLQSNNNIIHATGCRRPGFRALLRPGCMLSEQGGFSGTP